YFTPPLAPAVVSTVPSSSFCNVVLIICTSSLMDDFACLNFCTKNVKGINLLGLFIKYCVIKTIRSLLYKAFFSFLLTYLIIFEFCLPFHHPLLPFIQSWVVVFFSVLH